MWKRTTLVALGAAAALTGASVLGASTASAGTTLYVSPTGSGSTGCTQAAPCSLVATVAAATSGETIVMEGNDGPYGTSGSPITTELDVPDGVTLTGDTSQAMPVIYTNSTSGTLASGIWAEGAGTSLDYVDIEWSGGSGIAAVIGTGTWNRIIAHATQSAGCTLDEGTATVTDSVCDGATEGLYDNWNASSGTIDFFGDFYNSTIVSPATAMYLESESVHIDLAVQLENTIVRLTASGSPTDIYLTENGACGIAQVTASYSNYANVTVGDNTCGNVAYTPPTIDNNQTTAPQFVNAATNNFAEASASPTIGAGTNDTANDGLLDLSGALRDIGGRTDIGAYEFVYAPAVVTGSPSAIGTAAATANASVTPNGASTTYHVDYGTSATYGSQTGPQSLAASASPQTIAVPISGLAANTTYHYRVVATNSGGTTDGPDETFTTASPPAPPSAPVISGFTQTHNNWRLGSANATFARTHHKHRGSPVGTKFTVTLSEAAALELTFQRSFSGRRSKHGACVAPSKHNKHGTKCIYATTAGTLSDASAHVGINTISFDGVLATRTLAPGGYAVTVSATAGGLAAAPQTLFFNIVKR